MKYVQTEALGALGFETYDEYLGSAHWLGLRQRLAGPSSRCFVCRGSRVQLHHITYERLGHERDDDLVRLCEGCHRRTHYLIENVRRATLADAHLELRRRGRRGPIAKRDTSTVGALGSKREREKAREASLRRDAKAKRKAAIAHAQRRKAP